MISHVARLHFSFVCKCGKMCFSQMCGLGNFPNHFPPTQKSGHMTLINNVQWCNIAKWTTSLNAFHFELYPIMKKNFEQDIIFESIIFMHVKRITLVIVQVIKAKSIFKSWLLS